MDTSVREVTTSATLEEKKKLRKEFKIFDMIFIVVAGIIGLDTLGAVSSNGGQAMLYWISNPLGIGGTLAITAIGAISLFFFGDINYQVGGSAATNAIFRIVVALIFIWGVTWSAILSLHVGKWLMVVGSYAKFALFGLFAVLAVTYLLGGHSTGSHLTFADLAPSSNSALIFSAVIPLLIFNWVGFELQNGAGEEMVDPQRDVPRSIIRGGIIAVVAYTIPIAAVLFTLPASQLTNVGSFLSAYLASSVADMVRQFS